MDLIDHRGHTMPYILFPGGKLLLGGGADVGLYLQNRWEDTYAFEGMELYLNPHFVLGPEVDVQVQRNGGLPSGMCFEKGSETADYVKPDVKERLFTDLAARLSEAFRTDADLLAHVTRQIHEASLSKAEATLEKATAAFVKAALASNEARRRIDGVADEGMRDGAAAFVVLALPKGCPPETQARLHSDARDAASGFRTSAGMSHVAVIVQKA